MSDLIGGAFDLFNNASTNAVNAKNVADTNRTNKAIADATNATNMAMNQANIAYQRETNDLNYQRQLQENNLTRQREDTAYTRAASDLESAGLSKTLAAGEPASSNALSSSVAVAPEHKFQAQRYEQKAFQANAIKLDLDILQDLQKIKNISLTDENIEYQKKLNAYQDAYNNFFEKYDFLPGTAPWFNHYKAVQAVGKGILSFINPNSTVGAETSDSVSSVLLQLYMKKLASNGFSFNPNLVRNVSSNNGSSNTESSKSHNKVSVPTFTSSVVNDLPLESSTKEVLNSSNNINVDSSNNSDSVWQKIVNGISNGVSSVGNTFKDMYSLAPLVLMMLTGIGLPI